MSTPRDDRGIEHSRHVRSAVVSETPHAARSGLLHPMGLGVLAREMGKYTLAELEEEQSLERLRRWYRDLRARDLLGTEAGNEAGAHVKRCEARLEAYAEHVYEAVRGG